MKSDQEKKNDLKHAIEVGWMEIEQRRRKRIPQNQLATMIGIAPNTFSRFLNAESLPDSDNYELLVNYFGNSICDALGRRHLMPDDPIIEEIVEDLTTLDDVEKEAIRRNLKELKESKSGNPAGVGAAVRA